MSKSVSKLVILIGIILIAFSVFYIILLGFDSYGFTISLGSILTIIGLYDYYITKK